jgi:ribosomal protein S18 acetylase RimI-like enzyme
MHIPELTIRRAQPADAPAIAEVHATCWKVAYKGLLPQHVLDAISVERHSQEWLRYLEQPRLPQDRVWVASRQGSIAGFAYTAPSRDADSDPERVAELVALYVSPRHWRQGAGRALLTTCLDDLGGRGYDAMTLWVLRDNRRARRFYRELGLLPDGTAEVRAFGGAERPLVRCRKPLAPARGPASRPA